MAVELSTHLSPAPNSLPARITWRQRMVSHLNAFRLGGGGAVAGDGLLNAGIGFIACAQGEWGIGAAALATGIGQTYGGFKLAATPATDCAPVTGAVAGVGTGLIAGLYLAQKITLNNLGPAARIAILVTVETASSLAIGGVVSVAVTFAAKKTVDLYCDYREARARAANPEANRPLITDSEQPEVLLDPEPAQPITS